MRDDSETCGDRHGTHSVLVRISEALGIPVTALFGASADAVEHLRRERERQVLAVVQSYLENVGPEDAKRFLAAVKASTEAKAL